MSKITDVKHLSVPHEQIIPLEGYYVTLTYNQDDGECQTTIDRIGPFTEDKKHLLVEFLNILDAMVKRYPHGKCGKEHYWGIDGYSKWFEDSLDYRNNHLCGSYHYDDSENDNPDDVRFRKSLGLVVEHIWKDTEFIAKLERYSVLYYDGINPEPYDVIFNYQ